MKREKKAVQAKVRDRWNAVLTSNLVQPSPATTDISTVLTLEALERKVAAVRTWPFDLPILGKLGVMALSIILALVTQIFINLLGL